MISLSSTTGLPITGQGQHRYAVEHDWLRPPRDITWGDTHGLAQDREGRIYVAHTVGSASLWSDAILVFDANGRYLTGFGAEFRGGAHGLALRIEPEGEFLYVTDVVRCLFAKLTLTGEVVWRKQYPIDVPLYAPGPSAFSPTNFAFLPNGDFFLSDGYGSNQVLHYDRHGRYLGSVGCSGSGEGEFSCPHGLIVDHRGAEPMLVVADRGNFRLQIFSLDGRLRRVVRDEARLRWPCHFDQRGDLLVCPDLEGQVCLLDRDYRVIAQLGDGRAHNGNVGSRRWQKRHEFTSGEFVAPHAAIFLQNGDILVAEWVVIGRITRLRRLGAATQP